MTPRPYNLFLLCHNFLHGGSERQFVEVVTRLDPARFRVTVGCNAERGPFAERLRAHGCDIRVFPIPSLASLQAGWQCLRLARMLRAERFELVHAFDFYTNILAVPAARLAGVPVVASRRDTGQVHTPFRRFVLRQAFRLAELIVANSEAARQSLMAEGINGDRIRVIRNGVDLGLFSANGNGAEMRRQLGLEDGSLLVATVACLRPEKDHETLLAAVPAVVRRVPAARFLIVGTGVLEGRLRALVAAQGLGDQVKFLGDRADVPALLEAIDVAVLPCASNESLSNAVLEAMSAGRPVVATRVGGNAELIEPERTGYLVPPRNSEALADRIALLLERPALRAAMGRAARARAEMEFEMGQSVRRFEELYTELLERRGAR